jgi:hypothetical protein
MKIFASRFLLIIAFFSMAGISCNKSDANAGAPTIELIGGAGLITKDTASTEASTLQFRVHCKWNGEQTLTNFIVASNGTRLVDEGMNIKEFDRNVNFAKSSSDFDSIVFIIRDIEGASSTKTLKVEKIAGAGGGELIWFRNITLDAQSVTGGKGFLSLTNATSYTLQDAFGIQSDINLLYYFDTSTQGEGNLLASPGANVIIFTGTYGLSNWSTKNTTRFIKMNMTGAEFEAIADPIFVVNAYNSIGFRKAKNLVVGDVYSFKLENSGKFGILRVSEVTGQAEGKVVFTIVMQK